MIYQITTLEHKLIKTPKNRERDRESKKQQNKTRKKKEDIKTTEHAKG